MGATALTEKWNASIDGGFGSQNHFMLGQINEWLFHDLAGIANDPDSAGFKKIIIKPAIVGDLTWARGTYHSVHGPISTEWHRDGKNLRLQISLPANTTATVFLPATDVNDVSVNGKPVQKTSGVRFLRFANGLAAFEVGSGSYNFLSRIFNRPDQD